MIGHGVRAKLGQRPSHRCKLRVAAHAERAAAVAELRASQAELNQHLDKVHQEAKQDAAKPEPTTAEPGPDDLEEIDQHNFYDKIASADAPVVVIDFYTQWCGPCRLMYPLLVQKKKELAGKVTMYKFDCNKKNKELGVTLGIKVAPTFFIYKAQEHVQTIKGAKVDALFEAIEAHL